MSRFGAWPGDGGGLGRQAGVAKALVALGCLLASADASWAASLIDGTATTGTSFHSASSFYTHYANNHSWVAYHNGTRPLLSSSSDGATWTSQGAIFSSFDPAIGGVWAVRYLGSDIVAFGYRASDTNVYYRNGTLNGDGTVTWNAADAATGVSGPANDQLNALIANGKPIMWRADAGDRVDRRRFGPGSVLYFVGQGAQANPYGQEAVYELSVESGGVPMPVQDASPSGLPVGHYWRREEWEVNRIYQGGLVLAEDPWLWDALISPGVKTYPLSVRDLAHVSEPARLEVWLQGATDFDVSPDHHVKLYVNGLVVGEGSWDGKRGRRIEAALPPGLLHEGENVFQIENVGDTGAGYSAVFLNRHALSYPRQLQAQSGVLQGVFREWGSAEVSGVVSGTAVLDVTQDPPVWLQGAWETATGLRFRAEGDRGYLVVSPEAVLRPQVKPVSASTLADSGNGAEYLLLAPRAFLGVAEPLLALRRSQGLSARGVAIEDVFDVFGHGESRPEAIRELLSHAYHVWQPSVRYVLLLGDASYDPKDYMGTGVVNHIPGYPLRSTYLWTVSDPAYASVNGSDLLPDLAIGRLPAADVEQARLLVEKVLAYEAAGFGLSGPAVLVADDPDQAGNFEADAERAALMLEPEHEVERIYLSQLGGGTRATILEAFDRGASLMSYLGHGAIALWASERVLDNNAVDGLMPQPLQPLVLTMNCMNGYFQLPFLNPLAEHLVKAEGKGAIAAFSPSGLSVHQAAARYHEALIAALASGGHERLGDAVLAAQVTYADSGAMPEMLGIYHLFGDPALRIR